MNEFPQRCDVAIVGGGPAGLAAAERLKRLGFADVVVLERDSEAGGVPRHCGHYPFGMREFKRLFKGPELARRLVQRCLDAGVRILTQTSVISLHAGPELLVSTPQGLHRLRASRVILATGVRESSRAARLIGGSKPGGVLSTGALQSMIHLSGQRPFLRPVILGSELVSFSAVLTCREAGIRPLAMIEENARPTAWKAATLLPRLFGVELCFSTRLLAIHGRERVEAVELQTGDTTRLLETDGVIVSGRFLPEASLLQDSHLELDPATGGPVVDQFGRCSDPTYLAAGNLLRPVETAGWSWREGCQIADAIERDVNGQLAAPGQPIELHCAHPALRYVMPQRIQPGSGCNGFGQLQLRVDQAVSGELQLVHDSRILWRKRVSALPERRLLVPTRVLQSLPAGSHVEIRLQQESPRP
ncbi:NAD(P)/FAD-dependent oxidoreductase [Pseudomonas sp.]|uniref:NAD(P)/FAD-dependent oxidoreductase n=1 Tax=Pseudomonas sp. TaxID=306 RepID=UPI00391823AB